MRWHEPAASAAEGMASRGDRRMGAVIERVWRAGGTFQEWSERFDLGAVGGGAGRRGAEPGRGGPPPPGPRTRPLPWDHISAGLHRDFLWSEWQDALAEAAVEDCRWTPCYDCGACTGFGLEHVVASAVPPAGGSQGTGQDLAAGGRIPVPSVSGVRSAGRCGRRRGRLSGGERAGRRPAGCGSGSRRWARSGSPATGTWPGCGSGPCGGAGCRWAGRRGSHPDPCSASAWPCRPGASRWASTSMSASRRPPAGRAPGSRAARAPDAVAARGGGGQAAGAGRHGARVRSSRR